jgi:tetratricopeptide (TPR) repeat protein
MMNRFLSGFLILALTATIVSGQQNTASAATQSSGSPQSTAGDRQSSKLLDVIASEEAAARSNKASHANSAHSAEIYVALGNHYANAGMNLKAEDAMRRAAALLKNGPPDKLATEFGQLAVLHMEMGKAREAERDEMQALRCREAAGDPVGIALTWSEMSRMYNKENKSKEAIDYGQRAFNVLANRPDVSVDDRIAVRQSLGFALTAVRNCEQGMPMLKDALELSNASFSTDDPKQGLAEYETGFGYWQCGDRIHAAEWLERGTTNMQTSSGWYHTLYLDAMNQYARFLRADGQLEAADSAEAVVNQAKAVVDARTLSGATEGFRSAGTK